MLLSGSWEAHRVSAWIDTGLELATSAICWYEFLSGPVNGDGVEVVGDVIGDRVLPFGPREAAEAARLFDATGRVRRLRVDAMIAAAAIVAEAELATENGEDFRRFVELGLQLLA